MATKKLVAFSKTAFVPAPAGDQSESPAQQIVNVQPTSKADSRMTAVGRALCTAAGIPEYILSNLPPGARAISAINDPLFALLLETTEDKVEELEGWVAAVTEEGKLVTHFKEELQLDPPEGHPSVKAARELSGDVDLLHVTFDDVRPTFPVDRVRVWYPHELEYCSPMWAVIKQVVNSRVVSMNLETFEPAKRCHQFVETVLVVCLELCRFKIQEITREDLESTVKIQHSEDVVEPTTVSLVSGVKDGDMSSRLLWNDSLVSTFPLERTILSSRQHSVEALLNDTDHMRIWVVSSLQDGMKFASKALLVIIGDAGDFDLQAVFSADVDLMFKWFSIKPDDVQQATPNKRCLIAPDDPLRQLPADQFTDVIVDDQEIIVLNNLGVSNVMPILKKFSHLPVAQRGILYSGHGDPDGNLRFCDGEIHFTEIAELFERPNVPGTNGDFLLNCCYGHKMLESAGQPGMMVSANGLRIFAATTDDYPKLPAEGIVAIAKKLKEHLEKETIDASPWTFVGDFFPIDQPLEEYDEEYRLLLETRQRLSASECELASFRTRRHAQTAADGLYMFPAECGDTYLFVRKDFSMLFDTGYDWETFVHWCWNPFIVPHCETLSVAVVSHVDQDHLCGLFNLVHTEGLNTRGKFPKIGEIWMNYDNQTDRAASRSAGDGRTIFSKAGKKRIKVNTKVVRGGDYVQRDDVTVHVIGPSETLRAKMVQEIFKRSSKSDTDRRIANRAAIAIVLQVGQWRALLCSDVPENDILEGLKEVFDSEQEPWQFDVVTVPHHGSKRNSTKEFYQKVKAKYYAMSTNGAQFEHPHEEMMKSAVEAKAAGTFCSVYASTTEKMKANRLHVYEGPNCPQLPEPGTGPKYIRFGLDGSISHQ